MKNILFVLFLSLFCFSCNEETLDLQLETKAKINNDLKGIVWEPVWVGAQDFDKDGQPVGSMKSIPTSQSPIHSLTFGNNVIKQEGIFEGALAYDVTSITYGVDTVPNPHVLHVRTNVGKWFFLKIPHDYKELKADFLVIGDKIYRVTFRRK